MSSPIGSPTARPATTWRRVDHHTFAGNRGGDYAGYIHKADGRYTYTDQVGRCIGSFHDLTTAMTVGAMAAGLSVRPDTP